MKLNEFIKIVERVIPLEWALENDPVGLQIGDGNREIQRVALAMETSAKLLQKVTAKKADLLFVHHPLLFRPLKRILENDPVQRLARELIRRDIALYAAHTNLDLHPQGMAKIWALKLGCKSAKPLLARPQADQLKIVTFIPPGHVDHVREALAKAGAGRIGEYDLCSFNLEGVGTFRGSEHTNPFLGQAGVFEQEQEIRLEMILPTKRQNAVVNALYASHPYEEPAYDLYPLQSGRDIQQAVWLAEFEKKITWQELEKRVDKSLPLSPTFVNVRPDPQRKIKTLAISTGSGSSLIPLASSLGGDAYLTGEVGYHQLWEAEERGLNVMTVGHGSSESLFPETVHALLQKHVDGIDWELM
jgi:dinuclear metal center YbgI/SA1388 family protein